ncbi:vesicle coat component [Ascosphaera aggregata]|nr:vesicle coat component [Ascosphaera aggregata]
MCSVIRFLAVVTALLLPASALKFDLYAQQQGKSKEQCVRNFVGKDQLVVVTAIIGGQKGDGQMVHMHIKDSLGNEYAHPKDVIGEVRQTFTSPSAAVFDVCFENIVVGQSYIPPSSRSVDLDIDIGADARDWSAIQAHEKLKPVEAELRRIEAMVGEVVNEMEYMRLREQKLRDTNESTNERVKWFAYGTMLMLIGLGAWQILYLRAYFR